MVPFDAHVWLLTDPVTAVGVAPLAEVPSFGELTRTIRSKYLTAVNRWTSLRHQVPVGLLQRKTGGDLSRSPLWRDVQQRYDVVDVASTVFEDRFGCWGFLDLWRTAPAPPFADADADHLASLAPTVSAGLRAGQALTFAAAPHQQRPVLGPMVMVLDDELQVQHQTAATAEWLAVLLPAVEGVQPVPAAAFNVAAQLLAVEQEVDTNPATARVHLRSGLWVTLRAARLGPGLIAVTIEETTPPDRLELFSRCFGLSAREAELLGHVAGGASTRELADRMYLSPNTVQDHLKAIFAKTAVRSRASLLAQALGTR